MRTQNLSDVLKYHTGIRIPTHKLIRWANQGILGIVPTFSNDSKQRNFTDENFDRAFILVSLTKILNFRWTQEQIKNFCEKGDKVMSNEIMNAIYKLDSKWSPKFKEVIMKIEEKTNRRE